MAGGWAWLAGPGKEAEKVPRRGAAGRVKGGDDDDDVVFQKSGDRSTIILKYLVRWEFGKKERIFNGIKFVMVHFCHVQRYRSEINPYIIQNSTVVVTLDVHTRFSTLDSRHNKGPAKY